MSVAAVKLWGRQVAAVSIPEGEPTASFQYDPAFVASGFEISPARMPLRAEPYRFPGLPIDAFSGLPGLLSDSLPDRWGTALVNAWLASEGRDEASFDVVQRLCYVGERGMGALEFEPAHEPELDGADTLDVSALVRLAGEVLAEREKFVTELGENPQEEAMKAILAVGTSAGGARPKAIVAFNEQTREVRSGQLPAPEGFTQWLLKFDGVAQSSDDSLGDSQGWGAVEYVYWQMARAAGIEMTESRLLDEKGRRHYMTRRFDRPEKGGKLHVQTLGALEHVSYREPGTYSYEQLLLLIRRLGMDTRTVEQQFRRMVFNIVARNQDDHVKNVAFLMDRDGVWNLAPAYDLVFAMNPTNFWLNSHQMTLAGKRDGFTVADIRTAAELAGLPRGRGVAIVTEVTDVVSGWRGLAKDVGIDERLATHIADAHRLALPET